MNIAIYLAAAVAEIAGCFALWVVVRHSASLLWLIPGVASLVLFGWLLTKSMWSSLDVPTLSTVASI